MEGSLVAYKVFTNGSTLQASEVNENLMQQSVATFSNAAARTAAITSPVEGQLTYLLDTDRYESYNGTAWVSAAIGMSSGLVHIQGFTASGVTSIDINGCFSSRFENYLLVVRGVTSAATSLNFRMRNAGTTDSSAVYDSQWLLVNSSSITGAKVVAGTSGELASFRTSNTGVSATFYSPFQAVQTMVQAQASNAFSDVVQYNTASKHRTTSAFDSLNLFSTSNLDITGAIYGYRI
jgi:hypothetical protein